MAITWRDVSQASFGEANRLMTQGQEAISNSLVGLGGLATQASDVIKKENTDSLVNRLTGVSDGLEGLEQVKGMEQDVFSVDAARKVFGRSVDQDRVQSSLKEKKFELEKQAVGQFNELLAGANETGNFTGLGEYLAKADTLLDDASGMRAMAQDTEQRYSANDLYNQWLSGGLSAEAYRAAAKDSALKGNPYVQQGLQQANQEIARKEAIAREEAARAEAKREQRAMYALQGKFISQAQSSIKAVEEGSMTVDEASNAFLSMSPEEIGRLGDQVPVALNALREAHIRSEALTPNQTMAAEIGNSLLNRRTDEATAKVIETYNKVVEDAGSEGRAIVSGATEDQQNLYLQSIVAARVGEEKEKITDFLKLKNNTDMLAEGGSFSPLAWAVYLDEGSRTTNTNWHFAKNADNAAKELRAIENRLATTREKLAQADLIRTEQLDNLAVTQARLSNRYGSIFNKGSLNEVGEEDAINTWRRVIDDELTDFSEASLNSRFGLTKALVEPTAEPVNEGTNNLRSSVTQQPTPQTRTTSLPPRPTISGEQQLRGVVQQPASSSFSESPLAKGARWLSANNPLKLDNAGISSNDRERAIMSYQKQFNLSWEDAIKMYEENSK